MNRQKVSIITYHNVGVENHKWMWGHLICPWEKFQRNLIWLKRFGFNTISLHQLYNYKRNHTEIPPRSIVIALDDGYLDNWVFAYPLLKKYGFKATIFVNPDFVDPRSLVRKNLEYVWNNSEVIENLETEGFLTWDELQIMEKDGTMDVQSHSMTHTWYFTSDTIIDFHHPGNNKYPWLFWNISPDRKSQYMNENQEGFVPYGTPIYENGRALGVVRYLEDKQFAQHMVEFAARKGGRVFTQDNWKSKLFQEAQLYKNKVGLNGRYETEEEQKDRYKYELIESKRILEEKMGKKIDFLCWPGGVYNELSLKTVFDSGYLACTRLGENNGLNVYTYDPSILNRISPAIVVNEKVYYLTGLLFILNCLGYMGNNFANVMYKVIKRLFVLDIIIKNTINGMKIGRFMSFLKYK